MEVVHVERVFLFLVCSACRRKKKVLELFSGILFEKKVRMFSSSYVF